MSNAKETKLRPMPIRLTAQQHERLNELKAYDGISMQDHVRRAIDNYLELMRKKITANVPIQPSPQEPATIGGVPPGPGLARHPSPAIRPRVAYR